MAAGGTKGFTLVELLIVVAIIGVVAAIAVPGLMRARMSSQEASAVASLRAIGSAEVAYSSAASAGGFATSLAVLATACPGGTFGFISPDLATDPTMKSGYAMTLAVGAGGGAGPNDCNASPTQTAFYSTAVPVWVGLSGMRGFATSAAGVIWQDITGGAPTEPFATSPTVTPLR